MLGDLPKNDINGDGRSDLTWTNFALNITTTWVSNASGGFDHNWWVVPASYSFLDVADFTNKGRAQVLLNYDPTGGQVIAQVGASGAAVIDYNWDGGAPIYKGWAYLDSADVNGDRFDDVVLFTGSGWFSTWLSRIDGSGVQSQPNYIYVAPVWNVLCTGDFNGDGRVDILFRHFDGWVTNWLGNSEGSFTNNGANTGLFFDRDWYVIGAGDFNGDGRDDLLLRSTGGWITNWLATPEGGFTNNGANATTFLAEDWRVYSIGDFNGDGKDDLILRRDDGWVTEWDGTANGSFVNGNFTTFVDNAWTLQFPSASDPGPADGYWLPI